jgi:hypothetical protein
MNEKEARAIIEKDKPIHGYSPPSYYQAKGYLEAIEKAKVLVEALEYIKYWAPEESASAIRDRIKSALAQWEKMK